MEFVNDYPVTSWALSTANQPQLLSLIPAGWRTSLMDLNKPWWVPLSKPLWDSAVIAPRGPVNSLYLLSSSHSRAVIPASLLPVGAREWHGGVTGWAFCWRISLAQEGGHHWDVARPPDDVTVWQRRLKPARGPPEFYMVLNCLYVCVLA